VIGPRLPGIDQSAFSNYAAAVRRFVDKIRHADFHFAPGEADGTDKKARPIFLCSEDMLAATYCAPFCFGFTNSVGGFCPYEFVVVSRALLRQVRIGLAACHGRRGPINLAILADFCS
jgi:hypothetical protein